MLEERSADSCDDATNTSPAATTHLQQRSAGLCDDASDTIAYFLQLLIACYKCVPQVRATTQPTVLPTRCNSASRFATALRRFVRRRSRHCCPFVATAHRLSQQRCAPPRSTCCSTVPSDATELCVLQPSTILLLPSAADRRSTCCSAVHRRHLSKRSAVPVAAECSLLRRNRTRCSA